MGKVLELSDDTYHQLAELAQHQRRTLDVAACNRNGPGLQSARFPAHITCLYPSPPAHITCL